MVNMSPMHSPKSAHDRRGWRFAIPQSSTLPLFQPTYPKSAQTRDIFECCVSASSTCSSCLHVSSTLSPKVLETEHSLKVQTVESSPHVSSMLSKRCSTQGTHWSLHFRRSNAISIPTRAFLLARERLNKTLGRWKPCFHSLILNPHHTMGTELKFYTHISSTVGH